MADLGWDAYLVELGGAPASILVDLDAIDDAPDAQRPWLHELRVSINTPDEYGFPTEAECDVLNEAEEQVLTDEVLAPLGFRMVGSVTSDSTRTTILYGTSDKDGGLTAALQAAMPNNTVEHVATNDPEWDRYLEELYPTPLELNLSIAHHILQQMEEEGDNLQTARSIDHWASFPDEATRDAFATAVEAQGFTITARETQEDDAVPEVLQFTRSEAPTHDHMDELICAVMELVEANDGEYEGWEAPPANAA